MWYDFLCEIYFQCKNLFSMLNVFTLWNAFLSEIEFYVCLCRPEIFLELFFGHLKWVSMGTQGWEPLGSCHFVLYWFSQAGMATWAISVYHLHYPIVFPLIFQALLFALLTFYPSALSFPAMQTASLWKSHLPESPYTRQGNASPQQQRKMLFFLLLSTDNKLFTHVPCRPFPAVSAHVKETAWCDYSWH